MIVLPWPPVELSPNDRAHRMVKARKGAKYRRDAFFATKAAKAAPGRTVIITFRPPNNARRDGDNCLASIKSGLDGIADALGMNDHDFRVSYTIGPMLKGGAVEIEVSP